MVGSSLSVWVKILFFGILFLGIIWAFVALSFGMQVATAGLVGRGEARIQIQSAGSRIANYNHFFDKCSSIQGHEGGIDALLDELALYERGSDDFSRVATNLTGVKSARARAIAEYNNNAQKDYTSGQFRDSDLPYVLDTTPYPQVGRHTVCIASPSS